MVNAPMTNSPHDVQDKAYPTFFNLAALTLVLILGGLGLAYWLNSAQSVQKETAQSTFVAPFVSKVLASTKLEIPQDWLAEAQDSSLEVDFIDLRLNVKYLPDTKPTPIGLHLAALEHTLPSARLLDSVYTLRFLAEEIRGVRGLIGKPLKPDGGFENETVWYDPISSNPFVAKCIDLGEDDAQHLCIRSVQLSPAIVLTYQFTADQLVHWRDFDAVMEPFLTQILK